MEPEAFVCQAGEPPICDPDLQLHLDALRLKSVGEYVAWCAQNGFSVRLEKRWQVRCKERYFSARDAIKDRVARNKNEKRNPRRILEQILAGDLDESELTLPYLILIHQTAKTIDVKQVRNVFLQLLLFVEGRTRLLTAGPALAGFGTQEGNTYIEGLLGLARARGDWIRPLNSWKVRSHNVRRQFSSLAGHLLAKYQIPPFMNSAWFMGQSDKAAQQQRWYVALGRGHSPRTLDCAFPLSKRMAHHFLRAPKDCSVDAALRWGQVIGLGGSGRLVNAILGSRIGTNFENNEFWSSVIRWFIDNPMLDPAHVGPLIDYIYRQKFEPQEIVVDHDRTEHRPPRPDFSMNGRTAASLLRQMRDWHVQLRTKRTTEQLGWPQTGIGEFERTESALASNNLQRLTIIELLSRKALYNEGQVMRHCVASYANSCACGRTSIWSMGVERNNGRRKRLLTIEVDHGTRTICQVRGKANRLPNKKEMNALHRWATQENLTLGRYIRIR